MAFCPPLLTRPRPLTPAEETVVSTLITRVVHSRVINPGNRSLENTEADSSNPTNPETRYQQPILDGGVKPHQQTTAHAQNSDATADFQSPIIPAQPPPPSQPPFIIQVQQKRTILLPAPTRLITHS